MIRKPASKRIPKKTNRKERNRKTDKISRFAYFYLIGAVIIIGFNSVMDKNTAIFYIGDTVVKNLAIPLVISILIWLTSREDSAK